MHTNNLMFCVACYLEKNIIDINANKQGNVDMVPVDNNKFMSHVRSYVVGSKPWEMDCAAGW
jgi:hypothetical protein